MTLAVLSAAGPDDGGVDDGRVDDCRINHDRVVDGRWQRHAMAPSCALPVHGGPSHLVLQPKMAARQPRFGILPRNPAQRRLAQEPVRGACRRADDLESRVGTIP
ncbi:MAG: hypothetical protein ABIT83_11850 [Massilia sp.]